MSDLDPFGASLLFKAVKLHFTSEKYDYIKYHGKVSGDSIAAKQKFSYNKQRYFFGKLGRHKNPELLLVANMLHNPKCFVTDVIEDEGIARYEALVARAASRYYRLEQDLLIFESIKELLNIDDLPPIINKYISDEITAESIVLIDSVTKILDRVDEQSHPLVEKHLLKLRKYRSFVQIDVNRVKAIFEKRWSH